MDHFNSLTVFHFNENSKAGTLYQTFIKFQYEHIEVHENLVFPKSLSHTLSAQDRYKSFTNRNAFLNDLSISCIKIATKELHVVNTQTVKLCTCDEGTSDGQCFPSMAIQVGKMGNIGRKLEIQGGHFFRQCFKHGPLHFRSGQSFLHKCINKANDKIGMDSKIHMYVGSQSAEFVVKYYTIKMKTSWQWQ